MNSAKGAVYVPPRPNLGPESPGSPGAPAWVVTIVVVALATGVVFGWVRWRKWRARRTRSRAGLAATISAPAPTTPREQVIVAATIVRQCLAEQFGPAWNARTTEEIVGDGLLESRLPSAELARLALLLNLADRAKFGVAAESDFEAAAYGEDWEVLRAELLSLLASPAGASSTTSG